ncbi:hypothetical protein Pyrfu_1710 [Pyrolobus fumarii 1A]|uniref:Uncharacterized protein n=1 Tax=Pyrolobus fumarii (strain DSM 11204 / 1A) TaxID=694429 RepID=G0ECJ6_PYRF1|nr:hypothetical protein Pyrfu_1710 [Pyrolobus fumarii 1A]
MIQPRGDYVLVYTRGRVSYAPCNTVITVKGLAVYVLCRDPLPPPERCPDANAILVATRLWSPPGEAQREARRLVYKLMSLSALCGVPVLFANVWGATRNMVYIGYTGIYDYDRSVPLHLGLLGDGKIALSI